MKIGVCSVCGKSCELRAGMCVPHYTASWREKMKQVKCKVDGCKNGVKCRMMCESHYGKVRRRERLEEKIALTEREKRKLQAIEEIKNGERQRLIALMASRICTDCRGERSLHPRCYGAKDAIAIIRRMNANIETKEMTQ